MLLLDNDSQRTASEWLSHGRLPVQGEFMPLENDEDGERLVRAVAARKERYVVLDAPARVGAAALAAGAKSPTSCWFLSLPAALTWRLPKT